MSYPSMPYTGYIPNVTPSATPSATNADPAQQPSSQQQAQQPPVAAAAAAAAAVPRPANLDDEHENRDWLEIFYTLSRLVVLLSLVYFYSSPIRCSIVIFVMILYYL